MRRPWLWLVSLAVWLVAGVVVFASDASDRARNGAIFVSALVTLIAIYATRPERD